ncbi:MAG: PH domain-containing protein [Oscillospiraceae bacterium]
MIDFKNSKFLKMTTASNNTYASLLDSMLLENEEIIATYQAIRDGVVFTNLHIIAINVQNTGKKKNFGFIPYKSLKVYEVETAGIIDMDSEMKLHIHEGGSMHFEFTPGTDIKVIAKLINKGIHK